MTSRGHRLSPVGPAAALTLALALTGCSGGDGTKEKAEPTVKPTVTSGVTLTPSGETLELGEAASFAWAPDQNTKGLVSVAVTKIVQGSEKDIARIRITPKPEDPHLYYVTVKVTNLGATDLGGVSAARLPLYLDEGDNVINPPADLREGTKFDQCPRGVLPKEFGKGAEATVCLVYVPPGEIEQMTLSPKVGDEITWPGEVTIPKPSPSPKKKKGATSPKPKPKASATRG